MEKNLIARWTSKELLETFSINVFQTGDCKVVEIDCSTPLDSIAEEFTKTRARKRKEELKREYREMAAKLNAPYKNKLYNSEL